MGKTGRNDPCPCGSGGKYKHCCLARDEANNADPFRRILDTSPRDAEGMNALGLIALLSGSVDSAIALISGAVSANPAEPMYHCSLGMAYRATGRTAEAESSYLQALALDPAYAPASGNLGVLYTEQGRHDDALTRFQEAVRSRPDVAEAHDNLGSAFLLGGDPEEALACFRTACALKPGFALAYSNAGNALHALGRWPEAIVQFEKAIALHPTNPFFHFNFAKALCAFGKTEDAAERYRLALALDPAFAEAHNGLGLMLMETGRKGEAIASLRSALALKPDLAEAYFNLHSALIDPRDLKPSIECLRRLLALRPNDALARLQLYVLLDYLGDSEGAAEQLRQVPSPSAEFLAIVEGWQHVRSAGASLPGLVGTSSDAFRAGFDSARADGLVLEFGVRFGVSIRQIAALANQQVHGFDSFEGLPESWGAEPSGSYSTLGALPMVPGNVTLHRGWFERSLPEFLRSHAGPVRFMNVDCDIYSSTRTVLTLLADRIAPGTVMVFDEYFGHEGWRNDEFRAFQEAASAHGWRYEYVCVGFSTGQAVVRILDKVRD